MLFLMLSSVQRSAKPPQCVLTVLEQPLVPTCGCCSGSPYTSEVEEMRKRARQRLARPSMFMVPMKLVLIVLMGLYLGGEAAIKSSAAYG